MWAIRTMTQVGNRLKQMHKFPSTGLIESTQFWIDQEVPSKVSNLIVSGILYGLENDQSDGVDFLMQEALRDGINKLASIIKFLPKIGRNYLYIIQLSYTCKLFTT